jgi:hypothetical protein
MAEEKPIKAEETPINWLKELSGIGLGAVAILYVCGYLAHTVYYRVLGVDVGAQPLTYLTFSGDYLISILISIPQLFSLFFEYFWNLFEDWLWLSIIFCFSSLFCIWLLKKKLPENVYLKLLICVFIGLAGFIITLAELKVLRTQNALQPFSPTEIQSDGQATADKSGKPLQERISIVKESYDEHKKLGVSTLGFNEWKRWFDPLNPNAQQERNRYYLALLLLNIIFLGTLITATWLRGTGLYSRIVVVEALVVLLLSLLLFPCMYATLGRVFSFPVIVLELKVENSEDTGKQISGKPEGDKETTENKESQPKKIVTHPVFLVFQDESEIVIYDRLNLFQLKRIPRSQVLRINQLYKSSPFEDCQLEEGFAPCETLWIKEPTTILDF